jgi:hypothetical protein
MGTKKGLAMTHAEYANALRRIADWIEVHPDLPLPSQTQLDFLSGVDTKEDLAKFARGFGECKKDFGGIKLRAVAWRKNVCERVVVGTREVPEEIIPARLVPAHMEDIVEWKCPESLLEEVSNG